MANAHMAGDQLKTQGSIQCIRKTAFFALMCFAGDHRGSNTLLRIDNTTAISYMNKFGSVQHPSCQTLQEISRDSVRSGIYLFASHVASVDNVIANSESRISNTNTEWSLFIRMFNRIKDTFDPLT